jgi:5-bromo-4-chloroindolyl phosphate hydrolysis protein
VGVIGKALRNTDLLAGAGAVVLLLLCALVLQLALPISLALAAATYVGLRLALPKSDPNEEAQRLAATLARCEEQVTAIGQFAGWAGFAGKPEVRERLLAIARSAKRVLTAIAQDPNKHSAAEQYLDEYLNPITAVLANYVRLAGRDLELARDELAALETETLPLIERRLNTLYEQIHSADLAALELDSKMLAYTLQPISPEPGRTALDPAALPDRPERGRRWRGRAEDPGAQKERAG